MCQKNDVFQSEAFIKIVGKSDEAVLEFSIDTKILPYS